MSKPMTPDEHYLSKLEWEKRAISAESRANALALENERLKARVRELEHDLQKVALDARARERSLLRKFRAV